MTADAPQATDPVYGQDCPKGMVQVEFVGVSPDLKQGQYGWRPSQSAFIELWVDGQRFRIDAGWVTDSFGQRCRGIHVFVPMGAEVRKDSVNTVSLVLPETAETAP